MKNIHSLAPAFLGHSLTQLVSTIEMQGDQFLKEQGFEAPSRICSVLLTLNTNGDSSIADIAHSLGLSHQLVTQRINLLIKLGVAEEYAHPEDGRKCLICLTQKGKKQAQGLLGISNLAGRAYQELFNELGVDFERVVLQVNTALKERSISLRARDLTETKRKKTS